MFCIFDMLWIFRTIKENMRQFINLLHFTILLSCFIGCEKSSSSKYVANNENSESDTAVDIVELLSAPENSSDFYDILNSEDKNVVTSLEMKTH